MRKTQDDRGNSFWDVFPVLPGQVNISVTKPGSQRGFHMHKKKIDYWFLLQGKQLVMLMNDDQEIIKSFVMEVGDELEIPTGVWHAYKNIGETDSVMVYYETNKSGIDRDDDFERLISIADIAKINGQS